MIAAVGAYGTTIGTYETTNVAVEVVSGRKTLGQGAVEVAPDIVLTVAGAGAVKVAPYVMDALKPVMAAAKPHIDNVVDSVRGLVRGASNRGVQIDEGKFDHLFGRVTSNPHNTARSQQLQSELGQIGIWDTPSGRQTLTSHFDDVAADPSNVLRTYTETRNGVTQTFQVREALLAGPGGFVRLESTFETMADGTSRFITTIPYR